jgi:cell division transport system permease protein
MKAWLRGHVRSFGTTIARLARMPFATLFNALVIGVALALPLGGWVVVKNIERLAGQLGADPQLSAFLALDAAKADVTRVEAALSGAPGVRAFRFVSKDEALAELRRVDGLGELAAAVTVNPLPDAFVVQLAPGHAEAAERLAATLRALPKVEWVQFDAAWVRRLEAVLRLGAAAVALLAGLLAFGLVAVTFNTIRLQILTQRDEIEVSRLFGATDAFIRRPFFYQGALLGLAGGLAAVAIVAASAWLLDGEVARVATAYASTFRVTLPSGADLATVLGFAAILGWCGAFLSVSKHLYEIDA